MLSKLLERKNLVQIRDVLQDIKKDAEKRFFNEFRIIDKESDKKSNKVSSKYLLSELEQILETQTIERTKYYIQRLIRALSETKTGKINDLNLHRWKEYDDILTDSLWILEKRDASGAHSGGYWGNFIPQIPNQLLRRYTKKGEWVLGCISWKRNYFNRKQAIRTKWRRSRTSAKSCKLSMQKQLKKKIIFTQLDQKLLSVIVQT